MGEFSWLARRPAAAGDPLTLSSPPKATPLWIILWRCSNMAGHGIARNQERALADINGSLNGRSANTTTPASTQSRHHRRRSPAGSVQLNRAQRSGVLARSGQHIIGVGAGDHELRHAHPEAVRLAAGHGMQYA